MSFDAKWEDHQRLALRFTESLGNSEPLVVAQAYASFGRRYAQERDALPQTDADRAFHLVAEATELIDYQLPFATNEEANTILPRAHRLLDEAISLDDHCYDAIRMDEISSCTSFESYYSFLQKLEPEVRAYCTEQRQRAVKEADGLSSICVDMAAQLASWPHLRWLATMAGKALVCGRNREALRLCDELLDLDRYDDADARFTAALAYAKLEDEQGLDQLESRCKQLKRGFVKNDAWMLLARLSLAHSKNDLPRARQLVSIIIELYPNAVQTLACQLDLPDGVFARLAAPSFSEDELALAVSEATVLTQEGRDSLGRGALGAWLLKDALSRATAAEIEDLHDLIDSLGPQGSDLLGGTR